MLQWTTLEHKILSIYRIENLDNKLEAAKYTLICFACMNYHVHDMLG